ncbi:MAG: response regulator [Deferribacteres bacterium]|nr:response regulator [candidate division KSB1 bacterium]MCB9502825.1 response regulator [Deferribacteres bacterium]
MKGNWPILLVEDDKVDAMTVRRALKEIQVTNPLFITTNGEEALAFLRDKNNPVPCIILLDLNMPKMNGIEFLKVAKTDEYLKRIPVIVLTTSKADQDRTDSYDLSVAGYMVKPVDYLKFVETMKTIRLYWTLSELPVGH